MRWLGVVVLWSVALLPLLPVFAALLPALSLLERAFALWFDLHCERDPARTLSWAGTPLAVCARCSGVYFGLGLGAMLRSPRLSPDALRLWVFAGATLMLADVMFEQQGLHGAWAALRVLSGVLLAYPVGVGLSRLVQPAPATAASQSP
jgi:uncharacterized membrane protein